MSTADGARHMNCLFVFWKQGKKKNGLFVKKEKEQQQKRCEVRGVVERHANHHSGSHRQRMA